MHITSIKGSPEIFLGQLWLYFPVWRTSPPKEEKEKIPFLL